MGIIIEWELYGKLLSKGIIFLWPFVCLEVMEDSCLPDMHREGEELLKKIAVLILELFSLGTEYGYLYPVNLPPLWGLILLEGV